MASFRDTLVHDLTSDDFADMYAQTIAYGLLSARIVDPKAGSTDRQHLPVTNPFIGELMGELLDVESGERSDTSGRIDFDELGVNEVIDLLDQANLEAVVIDFGNLNPDEDPVIHFYESFLAEYDPKVRMQRGVFYTPRPVVSYIVRSVDAALRTTSDCRRSGGHFNVGATGRRLPSMNSIPRGLDRKHQLRTEFSIQPRAPAPSSLRSSTSSTDDDATLDSRRKREIQKCHPLERVRPSVTSAPTLWLRAAHGAVRHRTSEGRAETP